MNPALENLEIAILLEAVFRHSGYDFRNYAPASIKRRIQECVRVEKVETISDLQARVLHDPNCLERFLLALSINVTAMFRDPAFYLAFRTRVVPLLRTYPSLRIWVAGCATGEEACSLAILLQEEGLYERCKIYATDLNAAMLKKAAAGVFPLNAMKDYTTNYVHAGGTRSFSEYRPGVPKSCTAITPIVLAPFFNGAPSQEAEGVPTRSTSPRLARSAATSGVTISASPVLTTYAPRPRARSTRDGTSSCWSTA